MTRTEPSGPASSALSPKVKALGRHRLVNSVLAEELSGGVHALSIMAQTPQQVPLPPSPCVHHSPYSGARARPWRRARPVRGALGNSQHGRAVMLG